MNEVIEHPVATVPLAEAMKAWPGCKLRTAQRYVKTIHGARQIGGHWFVPINTPDPRNPPGNPNWKKA